MGELGQCPLWVVSDVSKVDGIAGEDSYRVDFKAKLTLKEHPEQTSRTFNQRQNDPAYLSCHTFFVHLVAMEGSSAGQEELLLQAATDKATAECR